MESGNNTILKSCFTLLFSANEAERRNRNKKSHVGLKFRSINFISILHVRDFQVKQTLRSKSKTGLRRLKIQTVLTRCVGFFLFEFFVYLMGLILTNDQHTKLRVIHIKGEFWWGRTTVRTHMRTKRSDRNWKTFGWEPTFNSSGARGSNANPPYWYWT